MTSMIRKGIAWTLLLAVLASPGFAAPEDDAQALVKDTTERMLKALRRDKQVLTAEPAKLHALVDVQLLPHFDFARMSRWVLGRHWQTATPEQRERFQQEFKTLLVRTYARALAEYTDQSVRFLEPRVRSENDVLVRTEVRQEGGFPIPIQYGMYLREGEWKVYDVTIDGVSLVSNYRSAFASEINRGSVDELITALATRNGDTPQ